MLDDVRRRTTKLYTLYSWNERGEFGKRVVGVVVLGSVSAVFKYVYKRLDVLTSTAGRLFINLLENIFVLV